MARDFQRALGSALLPGQTAFPPGRTRLFARQRRPPRLHVPTGPLSTDHAAELMVDSNNGQLHPLQPQPSSREHAGSECCRARLRRSAGHESCARSWHRSNYEPRHRLPSSVPPVGHTQLEDVRFQRRAVCFHQRRRSRGATVQARHVRQVSRPGKERVDRRWNADPE